MYSKIKHRLLCIYLTPNITLENVHWMNAFQYGTFSDLNLHISL